MSQLNYTQKSTEVLQTAQATATEYGSPQIEQCHLLYALVADPQGLALSRSGRRTAGRRRVGRILRRVLQEGPLHAARFGNVLAE